MEQINVTGAKTTQVSLNSLQKKLIWFSDWAFFSSVFSVIVYSMGWPWWIVQFTKVSTNLISTAALCLYVLTFLFISKATSYLIYRKILLGLVFNISHKQKTVSINKTTILTVALLFFTTASLISSYVLLQKFYTTAPIAQRLEKIYFKSKPILVSAADAKFAPVYFWDYATWINLDWLSTYDIIIPYEKGPPTKLLSKIYFRNKTQPTDFLKLHGKRPRTYPVEKINAIFERPFPSIADVPLLLKLQGEAGLNEDFALKSQGQTEKTLYWIEIATPDNKNSDQQDNLAGLNGETTRAIGVPWKVFFWGPQGSVFQVDCTSPCGMSDFLENIRFSPDPKASIHERLRWTREKIKNYLNAALTDGSLTERKLLLLYLVSYITLDPRDPETFFHLGKLATNKETLDSALRYGRDTGLPKPELLELENLLSTQN